MNPFEAAAQEIGKIAVEAVKMEYAAQGHKLTGALIDSIEYQVRKTATGAAVEGIMLDYGIPVNTGVTAERIPYDPTRRTGAKVSKYIAGLQLFAQLRFRVGKKEALSIAFAIARKHKQQGMPTRGSRQFSKTGRRTDAIGEGLKKVNAEIEKIISEVVTGFTQELVISTFKKNLPNVKVNR
jgi:hypothetical protein